MRRTSIGAIVLLAAIGAIVGGLLEAALASAGRPIILPPLTLGIALLFIGVVVVLLAVPIRRLTRGKSRNPIDPFYATRVLILAKASALIGSLLTGFAAGVTIYLLTRAEVPVNSVGPAIATFIGAACLLAGGLIAEHMCTIPPSDDDDDDEGKRVIRARP
jgi:predicted membrane protein